MVGGLEPADPRLIGPFGLKVGAVSTSSSRAACELVAGLAELEQIVEPLLAARAVMRRHVSNGEIL